MDLPGGINYFNSASNDDNDAYSSPKNPLSSELDVNEEPQDDTVNPKTLTLGNTPAKSSDNAQKDDLSDLDPFHEIDQASGNEITLAPKKRSAKAKAVGTPSSTTTPVKTKKLVTPKTKGERKKADDKYKPKKQFGQLAQKVRSAVENFPEGRFRSWGGDTYEVNSTLELTFNAIENLRKGLKSIEHPKFDSTHEELDKIITTAEKSGDYEIALEEVLQLTKNLPKTSKQTTTPTPKRKASDKKSSQLISDLEEVSEVEVESRPKKTL